MDDINMWSKLFGGMLLISAFCSGALAQVSQEKPKFSEYPAVAYKGQLLIPSYYVKAGDVWRDDMGKQVDPPEINFGGKYHVGLHSCGTGCRYYTLSDLSSGKELKTLDMFSSDGEKPSKTKDGRPYVADLITRSDSMMIVARYYIDESLGHPAECRQRVFLLAEGDKKLLPITGTLNNCGN